MTLNRFFLFLSIIGFISIGSACKVSKSVAAEKTEEQSLLWELTGQDIKQPSYIFGTIHMIPNEDFFFPSKFMSAFEKTKEVYFEIDMNDMSDMSKIMGLMSEMMMKDNKTLKDFVSDEDYKLVQDFFNEMGLPLMFLERMKPMFLSAFTDMDMNPESLKNGDMKSYEMEIYDLAKSTDKHVSGLETMEFQLQLFDEIPYDVQARMLVDGIKNKSNENAENLDELIKIYKSEDISSMAALIGKDENSSPEIQEKLLINRNKNWIPIITKASKEQSCFYAVGAGHLGGKTGILQLLRDKGYTVKPYK